MSMVVAVCDGLKIIIINFNIIIIIIIIIIIYIFIQISCHSSGPILVPGSLGSEIRRPSTHKSTCSSFKSIAT
jgi:hypothetical protein